MQLLLSLVFVASVASVFCEDNSFDCYRNCSRWSGTWTFLDFCRRAVPDDNTACNVTTDSPLRCYQKCPKSNLTNVLDESAGIFNGSCAKEDGSFRALAANVGAFCTNWDARIRHNNCTELKGCDKTTCTFVKAVNDIAYAYTEDSVKYARSFVKLLVGALPERNDFPVDKGCDIIYRPGNAASGLHTTGVVVILASITSLIRAL